MLRFSSLITYSLDFVGYLIIAGIPLLILYRLIPERAFHNKIQQRYSKPKDLIREFSYSFQTVAILLGLKLIVTKTSLKLYAQIYRDIYDYPLWWLPISTIAALFIHDTYFYVVHRIVHHKRVYKFIHHVHHKSNNPTSLASYSLGFIEGIMQGSAILAIVLLIPIHINSLIAYGLISFTYAVYGHLGYEFAPLWFRRTWLFEILVTSVHHNMHHQKYFGNYGLYFRIWDRVFGTEFPDYVKRYDQIQIQRIRRRVAKQQLQTP
jgi:sterol desaturase/sphingolipid hydroxylase (fatty acid hydroxylase superfamily)